MSEHTAMTEFADSRPNLTMADLSEERLAALAEVVELARVARSEVTKAQAVLGSYDELGTRYERDLSQWLDEVDRYLSGCVDYRTR